MRAIIPIVLFFCGCSSLLGFSHEIHIKSAMRHMRTVITRTHARARTHNRILPVVDILSDNKEVISMVNVLKFRTLVGFRKV